MYDLLLYYVGIAIVTMISCIKLDSKLNYLFYIMLVTQCSIAKQQKIKIIIASCAALNGSPRSGELK